MGIDPSWRGVWVTGLRCPFKQPSPTASPPISAHAAPLTAVRSVSPTRRVPVLLRAGCPLLRGRSRLFVFSYWYPSRVLVPYSPLSIFCPPFSVLSLAVGSNLLTCHPFLILICTSLASSPFTFRGGAVQSRTSACRRRTPCVLGPRPSRPHLVRPDAQQIEIHPRAQPWSSCRPRAAGHLVTGSEAAHPDRHNHAQHLIDAH